MWILLCTMSSALRIRMLCVSAALHLRCLRDANARSACVCVTHCVRTALTLRWHFVTSACVCITHSARNAFVCVVPAWFLRSACVLMRGLCVSVHDAKRTHFVIFVSHCTIFNVFTCFIADFVIKLWIFIDYFANCASKHGWNATKMLWLRKKKTAQWHKIVEKLHTNVEKLFKKCIYRNSVASFSTNFT